MTPTRTEKNQKKAVGLDWKDNFFVDSLVLVVRPGRDTGLFRWFCGGREFKTTIQHLIN